MTLALAGYPLSSRALSTMGSETRVDVASRNQLGTSSKEGTTRAASRGRRPQRGVVCGMPVHIAADGDRRVAAQSPAADAVGLARVINDQLADAIARNPKRFAGFAALPTADPAAAADELSRMVQDHGFVGANINGHCQGRRLDDEFFWPILERAEALVVPLYLHPPPPPNMVAELLYAGNYPTAVAEVLASFAWGWHIETAIHLLRVILSGAFDRFPKLQFVIGHMGEALPFMLPRLDQTLPTGLTNLQRVPSEYLVATSITPSADSIGRQRFWSCCYR